ncbi:MULTISPECIES: MucR family transcriptional regulator [unclassified Mesorhizobium]|uniref:MucR family transcriptional regulator n=1 Tax=unclassified Mesorhizobium TaxID=325217 RepID=UPI000F7619DE|nr:MULTISPECIES: MucR family transcriptional regulator [unclassified Mesorhizobium]AZO33043.1 transcriptional regulator [Mesorhizobium sp. M1B.F.Ca.ET.045.04.1.1]TIV58634.1 MAG: transcriptional regulator [Mesorhizobium sp.]
MDANGKILSDPDGIISGKEGVDSAVSLTASVVSAYVSNNPLPAAELPEFIGKIYASIKLISIGSLDVRPDEIKGVARAKKSVTPEFIICLEDGKRFKSLKRHIRAQYGLTPDQYRAKWNLPSNYPMVAPNYSATRSKLAKSMGLGRKIK